MSVNDVGVFIRVGTSVSHGEEAWLGVLQLEVLVCELLAVDRLATGALLKISPNSGKELLKLHSRCHE